MTLTPTIQQLVEALQDPGRNLHTLVTARFDRTPDGSIALNRTSMFVEARLTLDDRRYLLASPLSTLSMQRIEQIAPRLKYLRAPFFTSVRLLRNELSYCDGTGSIRHCHLWLEELPAGRPLVEAIDGTDGGRLLASIDRLRSELDETRMTHNNLKPSNLYVDPSGRLHPIRWYHARMGEGTDAAGFEALRTYVEAHAGTAQMMRDTAAGYRAVADPFPGHLWVGNCFEQMLCVEDETGYGYVDTSNRYVIEPRFRWANDFREGRAEVETDCGMGLIDKTGRFVIPPRYEIVEYDDRTGCSQVRFDGAWATFDYEGRRTTPFEAKVPDA